MPQLEREFEQGVALCEEVAARMGPGQPGHPDNHVDAGIVDIVAVLVDEVVEVVP